MLRKPWRVCLLEGDFQPRQRCFVIWKLEHKAGKVVLGNLNMGSAVLYCMRPSEAILIAEYVISGIYPVDMQVRLYDRKRIFGKMKIQNLIP